MFAYAVVGGNFFLQKQKKEGDSRAAASSKKEEEYLASVESRARGSTNDARQSWFKQGKGIVGKPSRNHPARLARIPALGRDGCTSMKKTGG